MCLWIQAKFDAMKKQMESMEMEVIEARLIRAAELNGEMDDDDEAGKKTTFKKSLRHLYKTFKSIFLIC